MTSATGNTRAIRPPGGFSLVEILLVLAVLVISAALVAPMLTNGGDKAALEEAAGKLARMWDRARLDAINSGQTLVFSCAPGGSEASVGGLDSLLTQQAVVEEPAAGAAPSNSLTLEGIIFQLVTVAEPPGAEPQTFESSAAQVGCIVVFRPDGLTSDAEVVLEHEEGARIRVTLRGMTGATRVVDFDEDGGF